MFFLNQMKYEDAYVICYCSFTSSALSTLLTLISGGDVIVGQDYTLNIVSVFFQEKRF
jgi:hypothetical protein